MDRRLFLWLLAGTATMPLGTKADAARRRQPRKPHGKGKREKTTASTATRQRPPQRRKADYQPSRSAMRAQSSYEGRRNARRIEMTPADRTAMRGRTVTFQEPVQGPSDGPAAQGTSNASSGRSGKITWYSSRPGSVRA